MYERILFFGDSLTYGQDSGGDGIDDPAKSYPAVLARKLNRPFLNFAKPGLSNLAINLQIKDALLQKEILPTDLIIIGWSSVHRESTTVYDSKPSANSRNIVTVNIDHTDSHHSLIRQYASIMALEETWFLYEKNENYVLAALALLNQYKVISFDMIFQLDYAPESVLTRAPSLFANDYPAYKLINEVQGFGLSRSSHFYEDGYAALADAVHGFVRERYGDE